MISHNKSRSNNKNRENRTITIRDIARRAEVSPAAVSFVLNNKPGVGKEKTQRIRDAVRDLNYVPSVLARRFVTRRSMTVALVVRPHRQVFGDDSHRSDMPGAVFDVLDESGYALLLVKAGVKFAGERKYLSMIQGGQADGFLILEPTLDQTYLRDIAEAGIPAVVVNGDGVAAGLDHVRTDDVRVGRLAASYLLGLGHKKLGFIAGSSNHASTHLRLAGFSAALAEAGVPLENNRTFHGEYERGRWSGEFGCRQILMQSPDTTAIFCCNDRIAFGAIREAKKASRQVPRDLSIIGVDNVPSAEHTSPMLTTIAQHSREIAARATELLLAKLQGNEPDDHAATEFLEAPALVVRETCAAPLDLGLHRKRN